MFGHTYFVMLFVRTYVLSIWDSEEGIVSKSYVCRYDTHAPKARKILKNSPVAVGTTNKSRIERNVFIVGERKDLFGEVRWMINKSCPSLFYEFI